MFDVSFLQHFVRSLKKVPNPRSKQEQSHPFPTLLALLVLGLFANVTTPAEIERWTKQHFHKLKKFLRFGKIKGKIKAPCDHTCALIFYGQ